MTPNTFVHRGDLVNEINRLGALYDIKDEMIDNPLIFMLCCSNMNDRCEAKVLGLFSQKDRLFHIKKVDSNHSCSKNTKKDSALFAEIQKHPDATRTGQLVEKICTKFKVGYYDIFKVQHKGNTALEFFDKENLRNTGNLFLNELGYSTDRDCLSYQKTEDFKLECLLSLKKELLEINSCVKCFTTRNNFYYKHKQMTNVLRKVFELKVYAKATGTLILGCQFDPCDEHIINSFLVSDDSKIKALEAFLEYDKQTLEENEKQFFIVDLDFEIIQFLILKNVDFFIKSRAISLYLQDSKEEDPLALNYFNNLNYGDKALLDLNKAYYLKRECPVKLYNLNNCSYPDFEFITNNILALPLIDCVISLIWLISEDLKGRKAFQAEELENKFSDSILSCFEEFNEILVERGVNSNNFECNLEECYCECGKFQENLFPCIHAFVKIREMNKDPFLYVSSVYCKDNLAKIQGIVPVVNVKVHPNKMKINSKKKKTDPTDSDDQMNM